MEWSSEGMVDIIETVHGIDLPDSKGQTGMCRICHGVVTDCLLTHIWSSHQITTRMCPVGTCFLRVPPEDLAQHLSEDHPMVYNTCTVCGQRVLDTRLDKDA